MSQSMRTDFPPTLEGQVVDGGVREGRPEAGNLNAVTWFFVILFGFLIILEIALNWNRFFP